MTQAFNLSQLANGVNTSGQVNAASYLYNQVPVANGGTALSSAGAAGNMLLATSASAYASVTMPTFGFRNRIINGAMMIDQRNAGASVSASGIPRTTFVADRFWVASGGGTNTAQRVTGVNGFQYGIKITGASGVTQTQFGQAIESNNTADLVNQNVTLSFSAQASANYTQKFYIVYPNTADNYSGGYTTIASPTFNITTSAQSFSYTFNAGANAANGIMIFASDTGFTTGFTATFSGMQLEKGSTATSFDYRPYGTELALCQRYFQFNAENSGGSSSGGNFVSLVVNGFTEMRASPTITLVSGTNAMLDIGVAVRTISSFAIQSASTKGCYGDATPSVTTTGNKTHLVNPNVFSMSAEL